jgi:hypothetical protein
MPGQCVGYQCCLDSRLHSSLRLGRGTDRLLKAKAREPFEGLCNIGHGEACERMI